MFARRRKLCEYSGRGSKKKLFDEWEEIIKKKIWWMRRRNKNLVNFREEKGKFFLNIWEEEKKIFFNEIFKKKIFFWLIFLIREKYKKNCE